MNYQLTNTERKYFGLDIIKDSWELIVIPPGRYDKNDVQVYFEGNKIVKEIICTESFYFEAKLNIDTDNRQYLLPRTSKGKRSKISQANINNKYSPSGVYFIAGDDGVRIANYTTQTTFYSTDRHEFEMNGASGFELWKKEYLKATNEQDLLDIENFKKA